MLATEMVLAQALGAPTPYALRGEILRVAELVTQLPSSFAGLSGFLGSYLRQLRVRYLLGDCSFAPGRVIPGI